MIDAQAQAGFDDRLPPMILLPVIAYAERFPSLPVFSIVECLLAAWRDALPATIAEDRKQSFDAMALRRLTELQDSTDARGTHR